MMRYEFEAPVKDPDSVLRHGMDWSTWLEEGETIAAQEVFSSNSALTVDQVAQADGVVSWRVSGGLVRSDHTATCRVTTSTGRVDDRSIIYRIRER